MKAFPSRLIRLGRRRCALAVAGAAFGLLYLATALASAASIGETAPPHSYLANGVALALWLTAPVAALWFVLRRLYDGAAFASLLLLFPGIALSLVGGGTGVITAALLGGALLTLESRPLLAGVLFGLLAHRPALASLVVPALVFGRYWRTLAAMAATTVATIFAGLAVFGLAAWLALLDHVSLLAWMPDASTVPLVRMPSVYAGARLIGADMLSSRLLQAAAAIAAVAIVAVVWHRRAALAWRGSALALSFLLATPYAADGDLVVLVFPLAWLMQHLVREDSGTADEMLIAATWVAPAFFWVIALAGGPPTMPFLLAALTLPVWRRAFPARRLAAQDAVKVA